MFKQAGVISVRIFRRRTSLAPCSCEISKWRIWTAVIQRRATNLAETLMRRGPEIETCTVTAALFFNRCADIAPASFGIYHAPHAPALCHLPFYHFATNQDGRLLILLPLLLSLSDQIRLLTLAISHAMPKLVAMNRVRYSCSVSTSHYPNRPK